MWKCPKCGQQFNKTEQDHNCSKISPVEEYISEQSEEIQPMLCKIRETIRNAAPNAAEKISYRMPTFWQGENLIHFAAFKNHISIFPGDEAIVYFKEKLTGYKTSKGTIQFPLDKPIDYDLIAEITRWRVEQAEKKRSNTKRVNKTDKKTKIEIEYTTRSPRMTREICEIPDYVATALDETGLWDRYRARPPYQQNDYIRWITRGKREETRLKRLDQMIDELRRGDSYMGMSYNAKK